MASWNEKHINCIVWINQPEVDVIFETSGDTRRFHMADKWNDWKYGIDLFRGKDSTDPIVTTRYPWASTNMTVRGGWAEKFSFRVVRNGKTLVSRWQDINAFTGNLGKGDMGLSLDDQKITIVDGLIIQYAFYDAGQYPTTDLPAAHQCYVTVAPERSAWMTSLVPPASPEAKKPFTRFVLPGGHNFGLNSMASCQQLTANLTPAAIVTKILGPWLGPLGFVGNLVGIGAAKALGIMEATSRNQKDSVSDQLAMGARYFEVRASRVDPKLRALSGMADEIYFHHAILPGITIRSFFEDAVDFLCKQRDEILVVWFTWNNWSSDHPEPETVLGMLQECFKRAAGKGVTLERGTFADMALPVDTLRQQNKRFIMSFKYEGSTTNPDPTTQPYDEYDSKRHAIADGSGIEAEFASMRADQQQGTAMTYLQCQTTLTNSGLPLTAAVMFHNSILLAQKANTDRVALDWLYTHAKAKFGDDHLLVILNDFFDLATSDVANQITKMRLWDP